MESILDLIATIILFLIFFLLPVFARYFAAKNREKVLNMKKQLTNEQVERKKKKELGRQKRALSNYPQPHLYEVNTSSQSIGDIKHTDEYMENKITDYQEIMDIHRRKKSTEPPIKGLKKVLSMPDLKKAVLLKEILDMPKGLEKTDGLWDE